MKHARQTQVRWQVQAILFTASMLATILAGTFLLGTVGR